jgi:hypothetical protein
MQAALFYPFQTAGNRMSGNGRSNAVAPDQVGALARYEELGVTRCIVGFNPDKREAILPVLDRWAGFMRELRTRAVSS